ncbi:hypothetical protein K1X76_01060 [bacterium]|nr:hypothetical protein [bacterium]
MKKIFFLILLCVSRLSFAGDCMEGTTTYTDILKDTANVNSEDGSISEAIYCTGRNLYFLVIQGYEYFATPTNIDKIKGELVAQKNNIGSLLTPYINSTVDTTRCQAGLQLVLHGFKEYGDKLATCAIDIKNTKGLDLDTLDTLINRSGEIAVAYAFAGDNTRRAWIEKQYSEVVEKFKGKPAFAKRPKATFLNALYVLKDKQSLSFLNTIEKTETDPFILKLIVKVKERLQ